MIEHSTTASQTAGESAKKSNSYETKLFDTIKIDDKYKV